jgi:glutaredoxin
MVTVEIFGTRTCSNCSKAIDVAKYYGLSYEYKNIEYKKYRDELEERITLSDIEKCPFVFVHGQYIGTYANMSQYLEDTLGGFGDQPI